MKLIDFEEEKAKKKGKLTPKELATNLLNAVDEHGIKRLIYIAVDKDGEFIMGYSNMETTQIIGQLEIGKHLILTDMEEW